MYADADANGDGAITWIAHNDIEEGHLFRLQFSVHSVYEYITNTSVSTSVWRADATALLHSHPFQRQSLVSMQFAIDLVLIFRVVCILCFIII